MRIQLYDSCAMMSGPSSRFLDKTKFGSKILYLSFLSFSLWVVWNAFIGSIHHIHGHCLSTQHVWLQHEEIKYIASSSSWDCGWFIGVKQSQAFLFHCSPVYWQTKKIEKKGSFCNLFYAMHSMENRQKKHVFILHRYIFLIDVKHTMSHDKIKQKMIRFIEKINNRRAFVDMYTIEPVMNFNFFFFVFGGTQYRQHRHILRRRSEKKQQSKHLYRNDDAHTRTPKLYLNQQEH